MGKLVEEWLSSHSSSPNTWRAYRYGIERFEEYWGRDPDTLIEDRVKLWNERLKLKAVDNRVAGFFDWLVGRGLASKTAHNCYCAVRSFCMYHGVELRRAPRMRVVSEFEEGAYPTQEELGKMVDAAKNWRDKALILLMAQSGLRISMACALKIKDIEGYWDRYILRRVVWDREQRGKYRFKGADVLVIGPEVAEYLILMLDERAKEEKELGKESWVFRSYVKYAGFGADRETKYFGEPRPLGTRQASKIIHQAALKAGLIDGAPRRRNRIHPHSLRKYFFNGLIRAGMDDLHREYLMNHTISQTKKAYFDNTGPGRIEILKAYRKAYPFLSAKGVGPELHKMRQTIQELRMKIKENELLLMKVDQKLEGHVPRYPTPSRQADAEAHGGYRQPAE